MVKKKTPPKDEDLIEDVIDVDMVDGIDDGEPEEIDIEEDTPEEGEEDEDGEDNIFGGKETDEEIQKNMSEIFEMDDEDLDNLEEEIIEDIEIEFDENLAEQMEEAELDLLASELMMDFNTDKDDRMDWKDKYDQALEAMNDMGGQADTDQRRQRGLSYVVHPMIKEAATQFNARAIEEMYPSGGPVKAIIVGEPNEEIEEQARRVSEFMNYQITHEMPEYFTDLDQMLYELPLVGQAFKKIYWCPMKNRPVSSFVPAEDLVISSECNDVCNAMRISHVLRMTRNEFNQYIEDGIYRKIDPLDGSENDIITSVVPDVAGIHTFGSSSGDDDIIDLIEMHTYEALEGIDGVDDKNDPFLIKKPYIITIEATGEKIVSIRRNWKQDDDRHTRLDWFISNKFLPGIGPYGFGLYHLIGGLGKAATGALRSLLDSANFANMQGGFLLDGRVKGGDLQIAPGEFVELRSGAGKINEIVMPFNFNEPSGTMFQLMEFVVGAGQRFANTADLQIGDMNQNAPVGTTVALIEQGSKQFSAIHKRLHNAQGQEFKIISRINAQNLPEQFSFSVVGASEIVYASDFDENIDIIPVSDPNIFSSTQRIGQAQALMDLSQQSPDLYDQYEVQKRMLSALRITNHEEVLKKPTEAKRQDAVSENMMILYGKPIKVFPDQDHNKHIDIHVQFLEDPSLGGNDGMKSKMAGLVAHVHEHVAMEYRQRMEQAIVMDIPEPIDPAAEDFTPFEIDPETDWAIAQKASLVVKQSPVMQKIKAIMPDEAPAAAPPPGPDMELAKQLMEIEKQQLEMRTQAEIKSIESKAQVSMQTQQQKAQIDQQIKQQEAQQDMALQREKQNLDMQLKQQKIQAEIQQDVLKEEMERQGEEQKRLNGMFNPGGNT